MSSKEPDYFKEFYYRTLPAPIGEQCYRTLPAPIGGQCYRPLPHPPLVGLADRAIPWGEN